MECRHTYERWFEHAYMEWAAAPGSRSRLECRTACREVLSRDAPSRKSRNAIGQPLGTEMGEVRADRGRRG
jgi:hypothetical protein